MCVRLCWSVYVSLCLSVLHSCVFMSVYVMIPQDGVGRWHRSQDDVRLSFNQKLEFLLTASFVYTGVCPFKRSFSGGGKRGEQKVSSEPKQLFNFIKFKFWFPLLLSEVSFSFPLSQQHLGNRKECSLVSIKVWKGYAHGAISSARFGVFLSGVQASSLGGISLASPLRVTAGRGTEIPAFKFLQQFLFPSCLSAGRRLLSLCMLWGRALNSSPPDYGCVSGVGDRFNE